MEPTFATRWFARHLGGLTLDVQAGLCAVCGLSLDAQAVPLETVLRTTFTDRPVLRFSGSDRCCSACAWYFDNQDVRRASWWLTPQRAERLVGADIRETLLAQLEEPPAEPGYFLISVTNRKHLALYAPLNAPRAAVRIVRFESITLSLGRVFRTILDACAQLREHHSWDEILSDIYDAQRLARWGDDVERFIQARMAVEPWRHTPYLTLARFLLRGEQ